MDCSVSRDDLDPVRDDLNFFVRPTLELTPGPLGEGHAGLDWHSHPELKDLDAKALAVLEEQYTNAAPADKPQFAHSFYQVVERRYIYQALAFDNSEEDQAEELLFWDKALAVWERRLYTCSRNEGQSSGFWAALTRLLSRWPWQAVRRIDQ